MIEIKDLSKIQKRKMIKDDIFEADVEQVEDIADEYCKDIMARIETLIQGGVFRYLYGRE